jgi:hypothetical protein
VPKHNPKTGEPDPELADKLFRLVERWQGYSFISDGIDVLSREEILELAQSSLWWTEKTASILKAFLKREAKRTLRAPSK